MELTKTRFMDGLNPEPESTDRSKLREIDIRLSG